MTQLWDMSGIKRGVFASACAVALLTTLSLPVFAADDTIKPKSKSNAWSTRTLTVNPQPLNLDIAKIDSVINADNRASYLPNSAATSILSAQNGLTGSILDLAGDGSNPLFNLDPAGQLCLSTSDDCALNSNDSFGLGYTQDFGKRRDGLDYTLVPRAGVSFDDDSQSALVGALVKIGDDLKSGTEINPNTWYFFAGADAQAMTYTPGAQSQLNAGRFALRDQIIVGDAQAGLAYRMGDADLSLTYLRREARAENYKFEEDAAALSFTWRR